jgi:PAS domain S-box-containing protein
MAKKKKFDGAYLEDLGRRASDQLKSSPPDFTHLTDYDVKKLYTELQIYKIELEMQNEELRRTVNALQSQERYRMLYDHAPVGYISFNRSGVVRDANLVIAEILGTVKSRLLFKPFIVHVSPAESDLFFMHLHHVFTTKGRYTSEIRLKTVNDKEFHGNLDSIFIENAPGEGACRTAITDISERKGLQERLYEAYERMEKSNSALRAEIMERTRLATEREHLVEELQNAISNVRVLKGLLPICMYCKNVRNDKGYWEKIEEYVSNNTDAYFSHGLCPGCTQKYAHDNGLTE